MKVWFLSQYFYPEPGATTNRVLSFARLFADKGHDVTVLCEFPNYPDGRLERSYRYRLFEIRKFENFKVVRTAVVPTARLTAISRLINYVSFSLSSFFVGLFLPRPHVIIATSPPLSVGLTATLLSIAKFTKLIGDIQDPWPEIIMALGEVTNGAVIAMLTAIKKAFYKRCVAISTVSLGLQQAIRNDVSNGKPIVLIYNGSSIPDMPAYRNTQANCFGRPVINVCFAGQIGLCQRIADIMDAALIMREDSSVRFTIIGDGVRRKYFEKQAAERELRNVQFTGLLSQEATIHRLLAADIGVVTLKDIDLFKCALPSKLFDYMAVGLPVLVGVDGEARELVETHNAGLFFKPGSPQDLVRKIRWFQSNSREAKAMGTSGRLLVFGSFSRKMMAARLEEFVSALMKNQMGFRQPNPQSFY